MYIYIYINTFAHDMWRLSGYPAADYTHHTRAREAMAERVSRWPASVLVRGLCGCLTGDNCRATRRKVWPWGRVAMPKLPEIMLANVSLSARVWLALTTHGILSFSQCIVTRSQIGPSLSCLNSCWQKKENLCYGLFFPILIHCRPIYVITSSPNSTDRYLSHSP